VIKMGLTNSKGNALPSETFLELHKKQMEKKRESRKPRMVLGIWGMPKTGKTGLALDFPDRKIYVLDWDSGVESTWITCHDATERIEVFDPIVQDKDAQLDIHKSEQNSRDFVKYVHSKIEEGENPIFVLDGVDTWFSSCILKVNPDPTKVTKIMPFQYGARNKTFEALMVSIYRLKCDVIYITHEAEKYVDNVPVGVQPAWRDWGGKLEQEIHCTRKNIKGEMHYVAQLIGSRTNGNLVGTRWTVREGTPPNVVWNGIPELREGKI